MNCNRQIIFDHNILEQITRRAREFRVDRHLSALKEKERQKEILKKVKKILPVYKSSRGLKAALQKFLDNHFAPDHTEIKIKARKTLKKNEPKDNVFYIFNAAGEMILVAKAFYQPYKISSKFLWEISSLDIIKQKKLSNVSPIEPLACAICSDGKSEWGILVQSVAAGKRMDQFIYDIAALPIGNQRQEALKSSSKAFARMGASLGCLHLSNEAISTIPGHRFKKFHKKLNMVLDNPQIVSELNKVCSRDQFMSYIHNIEIDVSKIKVAYSLCHGDAHLGNMFYDEAKDLFYFIDVSKMHKSLCNRGFPLLDGCVDIVRAEENCRRKALGILTAEETENLISAMYEAYSSSTQVRPDLRLLTFYKTRIKLGRLNSYWNYRDQKNIRKQNEEKAIFEDALSYFVARISSV